MHELVVNLHMHTRYSDGHGSHADIARAALQAGIDAVIVTDHNVLVDGPQGYYEEDDRRVLMLVGEEIHDQSRDPQKSHLLVVGADRELAPLAYDIQALVDAARKAGALTFAAHPTDPAAPAVGEGDISWVDWDVQGLTGIELWNSLSEFKSRLRSKAHAVYYAFNPSQIARGPFPEVLEKWDQLLVQGRRLVAVGGSDAHALPGRLGPLRRTLFPYEFHFRSINTHLLVPNPLTGEEPTDRRMVLNALEAGCSFIGYDLPAPTNGFGFTANDIQGNVPMGGEANAKNGVTFQIRLPLETECRLVCNGKTVKKWKGRKTCTYITSEPGVYRVEAYIRYRGRRRGWIFSNPIWVR